MGKYVALRDSYISLVEAVRHAAGENGVQAELSWIDSETLTEENAGKKLKGVGGIIVPGGFGSRGVEGMIAACRYAREENVPYLGICLGMQIAVIEFARNQAGIYGASSGEFLRETDGKGEAVIDILPDKKGKKLGGTMRLGEYPCALREGTCIFSAYQTAVVLERHRHRYEFNNDYRKHLESAGLIISGTSPDGEIVEAVELKDHPFFIGVQFHPEFTSTVEKPNSLFCAFIKASKGEAAKRR